MSSIRDIWLRVKWGLEEVVGEWGLILVVLLVAFSSFGLGRLSATEAAKPPVSVDITAAEPVRRDMTTGGLVVASKTGAVYHFPWCSGGSQIKPENQVWFTSTEAAEKAGYAPSKNCKGLGAP